MPGYLNAADLAAMIDGREAEAEKPPMPTLAALAWSICGRDRRRGVAVAAGSAAGGRRRHAGAAAGAWELRTQACAGQLRSVAALAAARAVHAARRRCSRSTA